MLSDPVQHYLVEHLSHAPYALNMNRNDVLALVRRLIEASPYNWSTSLKNVPEAVLLIERETDPALSFKERTLCVLTGEGPVCRHGKNREFGSIKTGWKFCSKDRSCLCLAEHKSATIGEAKARAKQETALAARTASKIPDEEAICQIRSLASENPRAYAQMVSRRPDLLHWVMERTSTTLPDTVKMSERCYVAVHGAQARVCEDGHVREFASFEQGYRNACDLPAPCPCRKRQQSEMMSAHHEGLDGEEKQRRVTANKQTLMERHGVANAMQVPGAKERQATTMLERHGVSYPMQSSEIRERFETTFRERYGASTPGAVPEFQERVRQTNLERYGETHTMGMARQAYREQTGVDNPFRLPEMQAKATQTMLTRYGVPKAMMADTFKEQMREKLIAKYGVSNVMELDEVREKLRQRNRRRYRLDRDRVLFKDNVVGTSYTTALTQALIGLGVPQSAIFLRGDEIVLADKSLALIVIPLRGSNRERDRFYLRTRQAAIEDEGLRALLIFEDEWLSHRTLVLERVRHALGMSERGASARACTVELISNPAAANFLYDHHLQGGGPDGFANYGAFAKDQLVAVMTFSRGRHVVGHGSDDAVELLRFATDGRSHAGVAGKLFAALVRDHDPAMVISFADRRWSQGALYRTLGFQLVRATPPNYWYVDPEVMCRHHRWLYRRDDIQAMLGPDKGLGERQVMLALGFSRIHDCGSLLFRWERGRLVN